MPPLLQPSCQRWPLRPSRSGGGYYFRHALSQLSDLLREVEPEAALLVFQCGNYSVEFVVLSHVVSRHR